MCTLTHRTCAPTQLLLRALPLALLFAGACTAPPQTDSGVDTAPARLPNHLFVLYNYTGNVNYTCAAQLLELVLTPTAGGEEIREGFVLNPGDAMELDLTLLQAESFRIEVLAASEGQSMWWDSMALGIHGTTTCFIDSSALVNAGCNGIDPDGSTMVCG